MRLLLAGQLAEGSPVRADHLRHARRTLEELGIVNQFDAFDRHAA
jgi:hypothetical protein